MSVTHPQNAPLEAGASGSKKQASALKNALRSFKVLAVAALCYYVVVPQVTVAKETARTLRDVQPEYLLAGVLLQAGALFSYSLLTNAALPPGAIRLATLFRIQLSTKAVGSVLPAGNYASTAVGFRLLTTSGVHGPDAGFALGAAGLGSAVVLNLILWAALMISIPLSGVQPIYVSVALVGVIILLLFGGLVFALLRGQVRAESIARRVAARVTFVDEERAAGTVNRLASRLRELLGRPDLMRKLVLFAVINWLVDAASLRMFLAGFNGTIRPDAIIVAFCIVNVMAVVPITPGGLGVVEGGYSLLLVSIFGMPFNEATLGVGAYRLAQYWLPIPIGGLSYLSLRVGRWSVDKVGNQLSVLRDEAKRAGTGVP